MGNIGDAAVKSGDLMRRMTELERLVRELMGGRRLENSTIGGGGLRVASHGVIRSETFDGNLPLGDAGDAGWALGADRLALGGQFVGPVAFAAANGRTDAFATTQTDQLLATAVLDVPPWAEDFIIQAGATAQVVNQSDPAITDFLHIQLVADGDAISPGAQFRAEAGTTATGTIYGSEVRQVTGSTITVAVELRTQDDAWSANAGNSVNVDCTAIFRRAG